MKLYEDFHRKTKSQKKIISDNNFTYKIILPILKRYVEDNKKILDYGSGSGVISLYLAKNAKKVVGVDVSKIAIKTSTETAKELGIKNVSFYLASKFNIKDNFDIVLLLEVLEHVKTHNLLLKKLNAKLKKGGILILSTPSINAPLYRWGFTKDFDKQVGHLRRYSIPKLKKIILKSNFEIIEIIPNEGVIRNSLFIVNNLGFLVRFIKGPLVPLVTFLDKISQYIFGESDLIIIAKKL